MSSNSASAAAAPRLTKEEIFARNSTNANGVSFCIPRIYPGCNVKADGYDSRERGEFRDWMKIKQLFIRQGWGFVERVDVTPVGRIPKGRFKTAFVHFRPGSFNDEQALKVLASSPTNHIPLVYDETGPHDQKYQVQGYYWKVYISSALKPDEAPKPTQRPRINVCTGNRASTPATVVAEEKSAAYDPSAQQDEEMRDDEDGEEHVLRSENGTELDAFAYENTM